MLIVDNDLQLASTDYRLKFIYSRLISMQCSFEIGSDSQEALNIFPLFIVLVFIMLTLAEDDPFG